MLMFYLDTSAYSCIYRPVLLNFFTQTLVEQETLDQLEIIEGNEGQCVFLNIQKEQLIIDDCDRVATDGFICQYNPSKL